MKQINKKLFSWASIIEPNTEAQAITASSMPFIWHHYALMPDAHLGAGATVGSVIPTLGAIIPAAVGVDIGCGMIAVKTQFHKGDLALHDLKVLRESIERSIPLSAGAYNHTIKETAAPKVAELEAKAGDKLKFYDSLKNDWRVQLGTLGSGNHFIEVTLDEADNVWLFLHSGSRGIGNRIATHHIKIAQDLCKRWFINLPDPDLAYLIDGTKEFGDYITDLNWAQHFALLNREEMMDRLIHDFEYWISAKIEEQVRINCHHNFTLKEHHFGKDVWLSRKGAISADKGRPGLIPGSMGTASYVVEGLGNPLAFNSSPHGAGRVYSRSAARKQFTFEQLEQAMIGIEYRKTDAFLDEIPAAYKDIDQVMEDAKDLVEIKHTLHQVLNVKGD
jgi:tRNA-splicing ligase RtcB